MKKVHLCLALSAAFAALHSAAIAQIPNWIGTTDNWNTGSNWSTNAVPGQDATFNSIGGNQSALKLTANTSVRTMYLYGGNYTLSPTVAEVFTFSGGGGITQFGSGTFTINNNITGGGDLAFTGTGSGAITLNGTYGNVGNRWDKWNESNVILTNAYTTTNASSTALRVRAGSLILSGNGTITQGGAAQIIIGAPATYSAGAFINNANAALILDNTGVVGNNNTNRITDTNQINISNRGLIEFRGNALAASTETLGTLNSAGGAGSQIRVKSAGGQSAWLTFAGITTNNGAITVDTNGSPTLFQFLVPTGDTLGAAGTAGSRVIFTAAPTLTNGVMRYGVVKDESTNGGATFATYDTTVDNGQALGVTGLASGAYTTTVLSGATNLQNVNATDNITLSAASAVNALRINTTTSGQTLTMGTNTLTIGSATAAQSAGGFIFNGGNDYAINNTSGTGVTFAGSTYTYVNSNTLTINAPVVRNGEFTKAGDGALVINGNFNNGSTRNFAVDDGAAIDDLTINGVISSGNAFTKVGQGSLVLGGSSNNNGFTGGVNLNAGKIVLNKDTALLQNTALGSGAFAWQGGTIEARGYAAVISNTVNLGTQGSAGSGNQMTGNQAITFSGLVQGSASSQQTYPVVNNAAADLTLSGTVQAMNANPGASTTGTIDFSGSGITKITGVLQNGFANAVTAITKSGSGSLVLSGPNTYTGTTQVNAGYLRLDHANALSGANLAIIEANYAGGQNAVVELGTGNTNFVRAAGTGAGQVNLGGTSSNSFNNGGFASVVGTSTVNLGGAGVALTWGSSGFFQAGGALLLGSPNVDGTVDFQNGINLAGNRTVTALNGTAAVDGIISGQIRNQAGGGGTARSLTKNGAGTLALTNVGNDYSGGTTVSAGTLLVDNGSGSGTGSGAVTVSSGATLGGGGFIAPTGANGITVNGGGFLSPGSAGINTLTLNLTGTTGTVSMMSGSGFKFDLGTAGMSILSVGTSDMISLTGAAANDFAFTGNNVDFLGTGGAGFYKLFDTSLDSTTWTGLTFDGTTGLVTSGLTAINLNGGLSGDFYLGTLSNGGNIGDIYLNVIPEPATGALIAGGLAVLMASRRRRV